MEAAFDGRAGRFSVALGWDRSSIYKYLDGEQRPGPKLLDRIEAVGGNPAWIMYGLGGMYADNEAGRELQKRVGGEFRNPQESASDQGFPNPKKPVPKRSESSERPIALFRSKRSQATSQPNPQRTAEQFTMGDLVPEPDHTICVVVSKGPLVRFGISAGDTLIVDRSSPLEDGAVVVVHQDGGLSAKRIVGRAGGLVLVSSEGSSSGMPLTPATVAMVWGVVTFILRDMRVASRRKYQQKGK